MPKRNRLRRVLILCQRFERNLAYYRVGRREEYRQVWDYSKNPKNANFWTVANGTFIDMCVLEWCKLFADKRGKHYWENTLTDRAGFKAALLRHLGLNDAAFDEVIASMVRYRDKFLAHLDSDYVMNIPKLDIPLRVVEFYYSYAIEQEATQGELVEFDPELAVLYRAFEREVKAAYDLVQRGLPRIGVAAC
jgi:hypothetical protein